MDKHLVYLEIIFLFGLFVNLAVEKQLFLKILIPILLFLFVIKEQSNYKYVLNKYLYVGYGFTAILFIFIFIDYFPNIYFITTIMCLVVVYLYLYKILFNKTYGEIISKVSKGYKVKLLDSFLNTRKEYFVESRKALKKHDRVLILLSKESFIKKPKKIIKKL